MKIVLTIAGTDPSGAAGVQADLQVVRDHGHQGISVITSVLAQNTSGVRSVHTLPLAVVRAQLDAVFDDFEVAAVKVGLVPTDELVDVVAETIAHLPVVWDPVLTSGDANTRLFGGSTAALLAATHAIDVLTPNVPETQWLVGRPVDSRATAHEAARSLRYDHVLLKVGHLEHGAQISDIWADAFGSRDLSALASIDTDVRGTGCHLSTAIACGLADGASPLEATEAARRYLNELLRHHTHRPGRGRFVLRH